LGVATSTPAADALSQEFVVGYDRDIRESRVRRLFRKLLVLLDRHRRQPKRGKAALGADVRIEKMPSVNSVALW
jgi:hypothetical protein